MYLLILESLLERQKTTGTHLGDVDADSSHLGELLYHKDTDPRKYQFKDPSLTYEHRKITHPQARGHQFRDNPGKAASIPGPISIHR